MSLLLYLSGIWFGLYYQKSFVKSLEKRWKRGNFRESGGSCKHLWQSSVKFWAVNYNGLVLIKSASIRDDFLKFLEMNLFSQKNSAIDSYCIQLLLRVICYLLKHFQNVDSKRSVEVSLCLSVFLHLLKTNTPFAR